MGPRKGSGMPKASTRVSAWGRSSPQRVATWVRMSWDCFGDRYPYLQHRCTSVNSMFSKREKPEVHFLSCLAKHHTRGTVHPKRPRITSPEMANSIYHIVKNRIQMGPRFMSPESVKNIACVGQKEIEFNKRKSPCDLLKTAKKTRSPVRASWSFRG